VGVLNRYVSTPPHSASYHTTMSSNSSPDDDTSTASLARLFTSFTPVKDFPIPQDEDEVREYVENHPELDDDTYIHPEELHDDGVNMIAENSVWMVFQNMLFGYPDDVYMWNRQLGEGLRIPTDEWQFGNFAQVISLARDADDAWNPNEDPAKPDSRYGCPYCDESDSDDLSSSTRPSGSQNQQCVICGRSRVIG